MWSVGWAVPLHRTQHETSHAGMAITEDEWNANIQHIVSSLEKFHSRNGSSKSSLN